jgi:hypothetical protein
MDGFSAAASVIAVIQISAQIFDLCRTYYLNVKDAREDIQRLRNEVNSLQDILVNVVDLANAPQPRSLKTLSLVNQKDGPLEQCRRELAALSVKLDPGEGTSKIKLALRSLKWPLHSKEIDEVLVSIGRYKSSFALALSTDQTWVYSQSPCHFCCLVSHSHLARYLWQSAATSQTSKLTLRLGNQTSIRKPLSNGCRHVTPLSIFTPPAGSVNPRQDNG